MAEEYRVPVLNRIVTVRDPSAEPAGQRDQFGRPVPGSSGPWGRQVWAQRRDRRTFATVEDAVPVESLRVLWTIRYHPDFANRTLDVVEAPLAESRAEGAVVFRGVGPPLERGRRAASASHLELVTERRT